MNTKAVLLQERMDNLLDRLEVEERNFKKEFVKRIIIYASLIISLIVVPVILGVGAYLMFLPIDK